MLRRFFALSFLACSIGASPALAELARWEITSRQPYAEGKPRGAAGAYEEWRGKVYFAIDPANEANRTIVDLNLAPRNGAGKVEFSADFRMLVPLDKSKASGTLFYEVNNRGNPTAPRTIEAGADDFPRD